LTPKHHPSETLISACAVGALRPGAALVVRAHLLRCPACARTAGFFESLGGALLEVEPDAAMAADALDRALAAIERPAPQAGRAVRTSPDAAALPAGLEGYSVGRRRWIAPGASVSRVRTDPSSRELVYLLRIAPGMGLPRHTHAGAEFTCVLQGSFADQSSRYDPGDFVCADEAVEHSPVVEPGGPCVCLISTDAPLIMRDFVGRVLQPFAGV
jgi:putative transcriptional regulator